MQQRGFIAIIFLIGCATGGVASQLSIPAVRAGTQPTRWEYSCAQVERVAGQTLTEYGAQGWELVSMFSTHSRHVMDEINADVFAYCFKRPLP